jgi:RimJ/RimL family protein N-acetyltransferase
MVIGEKVVLRAWLASDLPVLQLMRNNLRLQRQLMVQPKGNSLDQVKDWLSARTKSADGVFFVIACKSSDQPAGYIQVIGMDFLNGLGKLGICIAPDWQGKGFGGEAIALIEGYLWEVFRIRKLTLEVLAENEVAIRMYTKQRYMEVGRLREHFYTGSRYDDVVIMEKMICS